MIPGGAAMIGRPAGATSYSGWNVSDHGTQGQPAGGPLTLLYGGGATACRGATPKSSGKYYWEIVATSWVDQLRFGLAPGAAFNATLDAQAAPLPGLITYHGGNLYLNGSIALACQSYGALARLGFAADVDNNRFAYRVNNGNWNNNAGTNLLTGTGMLAYGGVFVAPVYPWTYASTSAASTANFGATPFTDAVPTGYTSGWPA